MPVLSMVTLPTGLVMTVTLAQEVARQPDPEVRFEILDEQIVFSSELATA